MYLEKQANNLQIARELKCSLSTVKRQKLKAVDTLKEKLKI
jgi:DNA-binding NarL/FixJ family response regulator